MLSKRICLGFFAALGVISYFPLSSSQAKAGGSNPLRLKDSRHFQISIEPGLHAVFRREKVVLTSPEEGSFYIQSTYNETAREVDLGFGSLHNPLDGSERSPLATDAKERRLRGILPLDGYLFFLDSLRRQLLIWNEATKEWHLPADIVFDQVRPPADRGGEAPESEIRKVRQRLQREYRAKVSDRDLLIGFTRIPWLDKEKSQFLLLLRLAHSPLLTVHCEGRHYGRCMAQRSCFLAGLGADELESVRGIATVPGRKEIWLAMPRKNKILRLSASSCLSIRPIGSIALAPDLRDLSNMNFDEQGNLWVTLAKANPDLNGSLFRWDAATLEQLKP